MREPLSVYNSLGMKGPVCKRASVCASVSIGRGLRVKVGVFDKVFV